MEWVETTGTSVDEAKEAALDRLGVDAQDAEFEVLEEPRSGLFGRTRGVARVRARVIPRSPRPKPERRRRGRGDRSESSEERGGSTGRSRSKGGDSKGGAADGATGRRSGPARSDGQAEAEARPGDGPAGRGKSSATTAAKNPTTPKNPTAPKKERDTMDSAAQCEVVTTFLDGLVAAMGLDATTSAGMDGDVLHAAVDGSEVGLLIGPKLGTLDAIQEIARNVLHRHADGMEYAKVVVDVAGVREMRRSALEAFVRKAATQVVDGGAELTFEVMSSADRKVVHDTVADLDGVASGSVGEDPRRRVVIRPA